MNELTYTRSGDYWIPNPYEGFMKEKSYFKGVPPSLPPKGSRCDGCPYWRGIGCVFCYREQLKPPGNGR